AGEALRDRPGASSGAIEPASHGAAEPGRERVQRGPRPEHAEARMAGEQAPLEGLEAGAEPPQAPPQRPFGAQRPLVEILLMLGDHEPWIAQPGAQSLLSRAVFQEASPHRTRQAPLT